MLDSRNNISTDYVSVHYFKTCRVRHWVSQETFLSPEFLILKVYSAIANIGVDFVPSGYPTAEAFGAIELPAAFIGGKPAGPAQILSFLREISDVDSQVVSSSPEERIALLGMAETVLGQATQYALWGHNECYKKFTRPAILDSVPRPYADVYCSQQREKYMFKDLGLLDTRLKAFLEHLNSKILISKFFFPSKADGPSICDIVLYAHLSVLLSIPEKFCPFYFCKDPDEETKEIIHRLRSFLLDFDDHLWHLNAQRSDQIDTRGPLPSASKAAATGDQEEEPSETETSVPETQRPLLGTTERMQNIVFLSCAAAAIAGVMYLNRK
jgi:hypothetical protein